MAKDYVRKRHVRQRSNVSRQLVTLLTSFLCGYLTATIFDFTSLTTWVNKNVLNQDKPPTEAKKIAKHQAVKPKFEFYTLLAKDNSPPMPANRVVMTAGKPSQQTITSQLSPTNLATQGAVQSASNVQQALPQSITSQKPTVSLAQQLRQTTVLADNKLATLTNRHAKEAFLIQIAAFNKRQDAEHLKASLVLRGFDVNISPILKQNVNWYRVIIGPFPSRVEAERAQIAVAKSERMRGMIRKVDA